MLSELIGASDFHEKVQGLARSNLVQQGGELAYLIRHDPEFRGVRREHLEETGRRVRLRSHIPALVELLERGIDGHRFSFFVISAAPQEVIQSALDGIVPPIASSAPSSSTTPDDGRGALGAARARRLRQGRRGRGARKRAMGIAPDRTIYVGDGSSDVHVMLHVNNRDGFTIAVSENRQLARIAKSTVLSDNAFSIMAPVLERVLRWTTGEIRSLFEANGLSLHEWEKARTDRITCARPTRKPATSTRSAPPRAACITRPGRLFSNRPRRMAPPRSRQSHDRAGSQRRGADHD